MSRGPGRIERAIRELFDANPDRAFRTQDLVGHCFPNAEIEYKHTVSTLRAANKVVATDPNWAKHNSRHATAEAVFCNIDNLKSYALMRAYFDTLNRPKPRWPLNPDAPFSWERLEEELTTSALYRWQMTPHGGEWWHAVELHRARRDGDTDTVTKFREMGVSEPVPAETVDTLLTALWNQNPPTWNGEAPPPEMPPRVEKLLKRKMKKELRKNLTKAGWTPGW